MSELALVYCKLFSLFSYRGGGGSPKRPNRLALCYVEYSLFSLLLCIAEKHSSINARFSYSFSSFKRILWMLTDFLGMLIRDMHRKNFSTFISSVLIFLLLFYVFVCFSLDSLSISTGLNGKQISIATHFRHLIGVKDYTPDKLQVARRHPHFVGNERSCLYSVHRWAFGKLRKQAMGTSNDRQEDSYVFM